MSEYIDHRWDVYHDPVQNKLVGVAPGVSVPGGEPRGTIQFRDGQPPPPHGYAKMYSDDDGDTLVITDEIHRTTGGV